MTGQELCNDGARSSSADAKRVDKVLVCTEEVEGKQNRVTDV